MTDLLQQGIAAAREGRREEARALLVQVVEADERNEQAWLWLAGVVTDPQEMRICLENVLDLNPGNVKAQQGLAWVNARYGPPAQPAPATPAAPDTQRPPATGISYTGPTTKLDPPPAPTVAASTQPMPAQPARSPAPAPPAQPMQSEPSAAAEHPCPYCGAPTSLNQKRCTQCRNSLMMRTPPPDRRSVPLTILGWLWVISGIPVALAGLGIFALALLLPQAPRSSNASALVVASGVLLFGLFYLGIGRGLLQRQRWAYFVVGALTLIGLISIPCGIIQWAVLLRDMPVLARTSGAPLSAINTVISVMWVIMLVSLGLQVLYIALVVMSYRDFFGPTVRLLTGVEPTGHMEHYNNGVAYKNRGMWYMATKEWEAAVAKAPRDINYLHALGLAYAQLRRFDQARTTLDAALRINPEHAQLKESRALVDRLAGAGAAR